jgi:hypothetical protein
MMSAIAQSKILEDEVLGGLQVAEEHMQPLLFSLCHSVRQNQRSVIGSRVRLVLRPQNSLVVRAGLIDARKGFTGNESVGKTRRLRRNRPLAFYQPHIF